MNIVRYGGGVRLTYGVSEGGGVTLHKMGDKPMRCESVEMMWGGPDVHII